MNTNKMVVCMYANRHDLPLNDGAIFDVSDNPFCPVKTANYDKAVNALRDGIDVYLYVTGATPSLIIFLKDLVAIDRKGSLYLLQYDRDSNSYIETKFF
jgi:hypothetical protein